MEIKLEERDNSNLHFIYTLEVFFIVIRTAIKYKLYIDSLNW